MYLEMHEVEQFYRVWLPLLSYVNQKRQLIDSFEEDRRNEDVKPNDAVVIRNALWEDDSLRAGFIAENPEDLSDEDLALVKSWQHRVEDAFFIFRYLKTHTIFLSDSTRKGYGVHGILSPIEDIAGPNLPVLVKTVLIPFGDRIIYDSLISPYPVFFGGGVKSDLNERYRDIREREELVTSLLPASPEEIREKTETSNQKVLKAFKKYMMRSSLSEKKAEEHTKNIAQFAQECLMAQEPPVKLLNIQIEHVEAYLEAQNKKVNLVSFKRLAWFLRDTYRMYYDDAEDLLDFIKSNQ